MKLSSVSRYFKASCLRVKIATGGAVDAFRVPQAIALRKVGGNTQLAAELVASAKQKLADEEVEQVCLLLPC